MILINGIRHFMEKYARFLCGQFGLPALVNDIHAFAAGIR